MRKRQKGDKRNEETQNCKGETKKNNTRRGG